MTPGTILILNGAPSVGKNSVARALQEQDPSFLHLGIDLFLMNVPSARARNDAFVIEAAGKPPMATAIRATASSGALINAMHHAIGGLSRGGHNVVADHCFWAPGWLHDCAEELGQLPTFVISLCCPLEIAERRERERGDRLPGAARLLFDAAYRGVPFDLEVDTSQLSASDCATRIRQHLARGAAPRALSSVLR